MRFSRISVLLASCTALFGAVGGDTFHWSGRLPAGQVIEVKDVNGSIRAEAASGQDVEVIAYKSGRRYDPSDIAVQVVEHDGGVTICAVYPTGDGQPAGCKPGSAGQGSFNNDVQVDFVVRVPRGVRFIGRTVNGGVEAASLHADAEGHTVNGNVRLSTTGAAQAETVNGSIIASLGRITDTLKLSTVNGGITVGLPCGIGAEVHANTINGRISTDFPLAVHGRFVGKRADGSIGHGGPPLHLTTVNGSITLRRSF